MNYENYYCECCSFNSKCGLCFRRHMQNGYTKIINSENENEILMHKTWACDSVDFYSLANDIKNGFCSHCKLKFD